MQTSGIKIDINSNNLLIENSEKIEKIIKFAVKEAIKQKELRTKPKTSSKTDKLTYDRT